MTSPDPSPNIAALESFLESHPAGVRDLLQYTLPALLLEDGKATFGGALHGATDGKGREWNATQRAVQQLALKSN